nr:AAA family ATPase [Nocardioides lijunqiniae]
MVLINGAPGSGKSTVARAVAEGRHLALALDIDGVKHSLGRWDTDPAASGLQARRLSLALAECHLAAGYDVVLGQYLARTPFIEDLETLATTHGVRFHELVLDLDSATLAQRLALRAAAPTRPEHEVNNLLVAPDDAPRLVASLEPLRRLRPHATWVDAGGSLEATVKSVRAALG